MKNYYKYLILFAILLSFISCSNREKEAYQYHTNQEIDIFLDEIKSNYPDITSIETVGYSESGRKIKALIISDNPGTLEGEPAVRLTGGIHGDEKMSVELLIRLIEYLTSKYSTDSAVLQIVNSRYICVIPVFNPDGFSSNSRYNANGVDLNRNFNDAYNHWTSGTNNGVTPFSEAETNALKDYSLLKNFDLSLTYHTGAVLVNLPFDFAKEIDQIPLQYSLIKSYAKTYTRAGNFLSNPDFYISSYMDEGTINGGDWYIVNGSLQDWSYTVTNCLDLTVEIAKSDPVTEQGVQQVFLYNIDSIISYINRAGSDTFDGL